MNHLIRYRLFKPWRYLGSIMVCVCISLFSALALAAEQPVASVTVTGTAQVQVVPDEIRFTVGINANELTAAAAYQTVEARMEQAIKILHRLRIPEQDIQAVSLSLTPVIDYKNRNQVIGHRAQRDIYVKVNDISLYAKALEGLSVVEELSFSGVSLSSSEQDELRLTALKQAYKNAETKARLIAEQSGRQFGQLIEANEQQMNSYVARPEQFRVAAMAADSGGSATVSSGVISVEATVYARFSLQ